jgi:Na+-driven multidrug efflux pump
VASVFARFTMAGFALWVLHKKHQGLAQPRITGVLRDASPIMVLAIPAILTQLATPIGQAFVTRSMAQFGEAAVSGMAIVGRLTPLAFAVVFALSGAVGPIIGQNFGAKNFDRVRKTFGDAVLFVGICVAVVSIALFGLRGMIADLFNATGDGRALLYAFSGPLALLFFFNGLLFVGNASFNNLGHP